MNNKISELLTTRLSHDLVGNIGAISNGFELVAEENDLEFIKDTCTLLATSASVVAKRIKFFRLAFGLKNMATSDRDEMLLVTKDYLSTIGNKDFPINLSFYISDEISSNMAKIIMALTMILSDMTIRGGDITVKNENDNIELLLKADRLAPVDRSDELKKTIEGGDVEETAKNSPLYYALSLLAEEHKILDFNTNEHYIKFTIK